MSGIRSVSTLIVVSSLLTGLTHAREEIIPQEESQPVIQAESSGIAYPVVSSTYDVRPQIQLQPETPRPRMIPAPKLPPAEKLKNYAGFQGTQQTPWSPPDPTIAIGPNHVVETVNMNLAFYLKDGTLLFSQRLDDSGSPGFFEDVGAGGFTFDPKCFYDTHSDRYFVMALEVYGSTQAYITFAVSDDNDPNGVWYKYRTDAVTNVSGQNFWVDYPGVGFDEDAFYITGNLFPLTGGGFGGVKYRVFDKAPLLNGQPSTFSDLRDGSSASVQAAHQVDPGRPCYMVSVSGGSVKLQVIQNPLTSPTLVTTTAFAGVYVSPPSAPTLGGGDIDTLDARVMNVFARNGKVYAAHAIGVPGDSSARCRWYEVDPQSWPGSGDIVLSQQGDVKFADGAVSFFPAIAANQDGDVGMILARAKEDEFPSIWYARRLADDQPGVFQQPQEMKAGESGYNGGRWGDYFDLTVDPADDTTFWGIGEYATDTSAWSTWIGTLDFNGTDYCPSPCDDPVNYGAGTAGTGGIIPSVAVRACPTIGDSNFQISGEDFLAGSTGFLFLGLARTSIDGGGWTLLVDTGLIPSIPVNYAGGEVDYPLPIPNNPFLSFLKVNAQFIASDPGAAGGVSATNGIEITLCPNL